MSTPNTNIDPVPTPSNVNNDTKGLPLYPVLQRIERTDSVGVAAANRQHKAFERRTDTLLDRINKLIAAHNINADSATAVFLRRVGGAANAMLGILDMGGNRIENTAEAVQPTDVPRADQALTSLGHNSANLDANNKRITDVAPGIDPADVVTVAQLSGSSLSLRGLLALASDNTTLTQSGIFTGLTFTATGTTADYRFWEFTAPVSMVLTVYAVGGGGGGGSGGDHPNDYGGGGGGGGGGGAGAYRVYLNAGDIVRVEAGFGGTGAPGGGLNSSGNPGQAGKSSRVLVNGSPIATGNGGNPGGGGVGGGSGAGGAGGVGGSGSPWSIKGSDGTAGSPGSDSPVPNVYGAGGVGGSSPSKTGSVQDLFNAAGSNGTAGRAGGSFTAANGTGGYCLLIAGILDLDF